MAVQSFEDFITSLHITTQKMSSGNKELMKQIGNRVLKRAQKYAPLKTGKLSDSGKCYAFPKRFRIRFYALSKHGYKYDYAPKMELGIYNSRHPDPQRGRLYLKRAFYDSQDEIDKVLGDYLISYMTRRRGYRPIRGI